MFRSSILRMASAALLLLVSILAMLSSGVAAHAQVLTHERHAAIAETTVTVRATILVQTGRIAGLMRYTVLTGNTLSGIAEAKCGRADDWPGIYAASRKVVGADPNLIFPGQVLNVGCAVKATTPPPGNTPVSRQNAGVYGKPNFCGDGDNDGWDVKCPVQSAPKPVSISSPVKLTQSSGGSGNGGGCSDPSGQLTSSQVGMLWLCAGGPSWAEAAAIRVSSCESGWNTHAYNPSGASGLWQILGQVVAGYIFDAHTNALNAVSKFKASGDTWAQWVCKP